LKKEKSFEALFRKNTHLASRQKQAAGAFGFRAKIYNCSNENQWLLELPSDKDSVDLCVKPCLFLKKSIGLVYISNSWLTQYKLNLISYTKIYMICKIFKIDLLDFQGFNLHNFRKPILFEYKN
jgi:hypothetical protein